MKNTNPDWESYAGDLSILLDEMPTTDQTRDARALLSQLLAACTETIEHYQALSADDETRAETEADDAYKAREELETLRDEYTSLAAAALAIIGPMSLDESYGVHSLRMLATDAQPAARDVYSLSMQWAVAS